MSTRARRGTYLQIANDLRERIDRQEYKAGDRLPSEAEICERYDVGRDTARRAYAELEGEGLVTALPAKGRVVGSGQTAARAGHQDLVDKLIALLNSGEYHPGGPFLSEGDVAKRFDVTRHYARRALGHLEQQGVIRAEHGRGRVVVAIPALGAEK